MKAEQSRCRQCSGVLALIITTGTSRREAFFCMAASTEGPFITGIM